MSQVKVQGNASGTGVFTVQSPSSNTNRTQTLPDADGTLIATTDGKVGVSQLNATGTPSSATFLRGDNTWASAGGGGQQIFTSSGTFTIPSGVSRVKVTVVGGGGGSGSATNSASAGGGSGATCIKYLTGLTPGNTLTVTVGAGGGAGSTGGTSSVASGTQTITTLSAGGGSGTAAAASYTSGGNGGSASGGDINTAGAPGVWSNFTYITLGVGGISTLGKSYGSGGNGVYNNNCATSSGNPGSQGIVIFEW